MIRSRPVTIGSALINRHRWEYPIIHTRRYTTLPDPILLPLLCGAAKNKLSCPPSLTIVLIHNCKEQSVLETSLHYVGINDFILLQPENGKWPSNTTKLIEWKKYLDSGRRPTEDILYIDSDDAIVRSDLNLVVNYFREEDCDTLFSTTSARHYFRYIPEA